MGVEPPPIADLNNWALELQRQMGAGQAILEADRQTIQQWIDVVDNTVSLLKAQLPNAQALRINSGVVGSFQSALDTADNLNSSAEALTERLGQYIQFAEALRDYSGAAYERLFQQDGQ